MKVLAICGCVLALPAGLAAQDAGSTIEPEAGVRLFGSVVSRATGDPIPSATITFDGFGAEGEPSWSGESDAGGGFQTDVLPLGAYEISVETVSFTPVSHPLALSEEGIVDIRVEMTGVDVELAPIIAVARRRTKLERAGFYERRERATGYFLNREDIVARAPLRLSDLFRTVPGARVIEGRFGQGAVRLRGGCTPTVVTDGIVVSRLSEMDELLSVAAIEGIEVYHGASVPTQYAANTTCGVIMLWSRDPSTTEGEGLTWKRIVAAVGLAVLVVLGTR